MKTERLLGIITYLLNRDLVRGKQLAEKFEVSERTIQRDIDSINMAGIPVASIRGSNGGYRILDTFGLSRQPGNQDDLASLRLALESLDSAIDKNNIRDTLEKVQTITSKKVVHQIGVDFSVAREHRKSNDYIATINQAMEDQVKIKFDYTNAQNSRNEHIVEPLKLQFKWYAWYLVAYHSEKQQYRMYKVLRMNQLEKLASSFHNRHDPNVDPFDLLEKDRRQQTLIKLRCKRSSYISFSEHFHQLEIDHETEDYFEVSLHIIESERLWFALLLSFGDEVDILSPMHVRERFVQHAKKIIINLNKPDI